MAVAREHFSSRIGFVLAASGSAVGIGNLVGFPVAAAKNGGGAFLVIYILFVVLICIPVIMAELAIGRRAQKDPLGAYSDLSGRSPFWSLAGWLAVVTPFMIAVLYMVITVWIFGYLVAITSGDLASLSQPEAFGIFINGNAIFAYLLVVIGIVNLILIGGVKEGIERAAKILMPGLVLILIALVTFVLTLDNAFAGVQFYLKPDFSKIDTSVINGALSQAFFSLSLGMGILITYGSYMDSQSDIPNSTKYVALTDTAVAFTAGLMILPAIFSFSPEIDPKDLSESSISLIFSYLPKIFLSLQEAIGYLGASTVAGVFFLLVFFAAITSLVSIAEVPTSSVMQTKGWSRKRSLITINAFLIVHRVS